MVLKAGQRAGNMIVPLSNMTKRTKLIDLTLDYTGTPLNSLSNVTKHYAKAIFYADSLGNWFMNADISLAADIPTGTNFGLKITGILSKNATNLNPVLDVYIDDSTYISANPQAIINPNNNLIAVSFASTTGESGKSITLNLRDIPLNAEPTTYTISSNMEARASADVYIDHGTALAGGVVGGSNGSGIATGRIGSIVEWSGAGDFDPSSTSFTDWTNASLTLNKGRWNIVADINCYLGLFNNFLTGARVDLYLEIVNGTTRLKNQAKGMFNAAAYDSTGTGTYQSQAGTLSFNFVYDVPSDGYVVKIRGKKSTTGTAASFGATAANSGDIRSHFYATLIG